MAQIFIKLTIYMLLAAGGLLVCDGMWLRVKAVVARHLLENAWQETVRTGVSVKPWPWAESWPVARLKIERLGVERIILEDEALAFGPGYLPDNVGSNKQGNCVLAAHKDTTFTFLKDLEDGDTVELETVHGKRFQFQVTSRHNGKQANAISETTGSSWLTLMTWYPFDAIKSKNDKRYVVIARYAKEQRS